MVWAVGLTVIGNSAVMMTEFGAAEYAVLATGVVSVTNGVSRVIMFQVAFRSGTLFIAMAALFSGAVGCGAILE